MTQLLEYIKMAIDNLKSNKGRSFLTMLGIIIGISSVIMIISIGNGVSTMINEELNSLVGGMVEIYVDGENISDSDCITTDDIAAIKEKVDNVEGVSVYTGASGTIVTTKGDFTADVAAGTEDLKYFITGESIDKGRFFSNDDVQSSKAVCVINETDALNLFGTIDVIGMSLEVSINSITKQLTIIGLNVSDSDNSMLSAYIGSESTVSVYVPYTLLEQGYGMSIGNFSSVYLMADSVQDSANVAKQAISLLEARHDKRGESLYLLQNYADKLSQVNTVLSIITIFIVLVAAISLLVGGIGVMNIMFVSVTERTREIGIRKALGARTRSIMLQFLLESGFITLIGGIIGIILGVSGAYLICSLPLLGFTPQLQVSTIIITTFFSSTVGIFFGIYPARKAAKLSPIEALRRI